MEKKFIKENGHVFLCLSEMMKDPEEEMSTYDSQMEMIRRNKIPGILKFQREWVDNRKNNKYDITGCYSLQSWCAINPVTEETLREFLRQLFALFQRMDEYLLNIKMLSFDPEMIFFRPETKEYLFCFLPARWREERDEPRTLATYFLEHVDEENLALAGLCMKFFRFSAEDEISAEKLGALVSPSDFLPEKAERYQKFSSSEPEDDKETEKKNLKKKEKKGFWAFLKGLFFREPMDPEEMWEEETPLKEEQKKRKEQEEFAEEVRKRQLNNWNNEPTQLLFFDESDAEYPELTDMETGARIEMKKMPFIIGTHSTADYRPEGKGISRLHAKIEEKDGEYLVSDLNSTNGTKLNGEVLIPAEKVRIKTGDSLNLAGIVYTFMGN